MCQRFYKVLYIALRYTQVAESISIPGCNLLRLMKPDTKGYRYTESLGFFKSSV